MQNIQNVFLFILIIVGRPTTSSATTTPIIQKVSSHHLKFKEKTALWLLKRRFKKVRKQVNSPFAFNQYQQDTTDCSTLILNTGDFLKVQLLETTETDVTFKYCDKGKQILTLSKSDISQIVLSDGLVVFDNPLKLTKKHHKKSTNSAIGIVAVVVGFLGLVMVNSFPILTLVLVMLSLVLGLIFMLNKGD